jgi:hypothetical protein
MSAVTKREKEIRYNGLVIVRAYLGENKKIHQLQHRVAKSGLKKERQEREHFLEWE